MNGHPNEPLSAEERDLAARLARLGPHDGPSPELDATIMSAARQALTEAPRRHARRRWLGLSGGAGGLVTGLGLAASLTLVLGVVWQMRPVEGLYMPPEEGDATEHVVMIETLPGRTSDAPAASAAEASAEAAVAPPSTPAAASNTASAAKPRAPSTASPHADRSTAIDAAPAGSDRADASALLEARRAADAEAERASRVERTQQESAQQARAVELQGQAAAQAKQGNDSFAEDPAPAAARRATYTRAARATPERPERAPAAVAHAPPPPPPQAPAAAAGMEADDAVAMPDPASPEALAAIPVEADATLDPTDWLERIRARKAAGDLDAARASLALLRAQRPYLQVPDDLIGLLRAAPDPAP
ncbi:hypothetical protein [Marilutibacter spongiae]|uniref:Uncharacterized protein n=1 Tax=Marilutibacter spongiae TaxID=2025720 RepID=A0A7W3Y6Q4_9GAMM|nr:hypothetical protein [Lysobacter spongiae]MBB1061156.1 hypothetical protein [Lysobacter spongiae]